MKKAFLILTAFMFFSSLTFGQSPSVVYEPFDPEEPCDPGVPDGVDEDSVSGWNPFYTYLGSYERLIEINGQLIPQIVKKLQYPVIVLHCTIDNVDYECDIAFDARWRTDNDEYTEVQITQFYLPDPSDCPCDIPDFEDLVLIATKACFEDLRSRGLLPSDLNGIPKSGNFYGASIASCWTGDNISMTTDRTNFRTLASVGGDGITFPLFETLKIKKNNKDEIADNDLVSFSSVHRKCLSTACCQISLEISWGYDVLGNYDQENTSYTRFGDVSRSSSEPCDELLECYDRCYALLNFEEESGKINYKEEINNDSEFNGIMIYPNPSNGTIKFNLNSIPNNIDQLSIYSSEGIIVLSRMLTDIHSRLLEIDMSDCVSGIYFYVLKNDITILESGKFILVQ